MMLDVSGKRRVEDPAEADFRAALAELTRTTGGFMILSIDPETYLQCAGDAEGFVLEYRDGSAARHFRAAVEGRLLTAEELLPAFVEYAAGRPTWRERFAWERLSFL